MNLAGVDGCLLEATLSHQGAPLGHFLWRFGVLLAIDAPARQLLPSLPQAPPAETTPSA